LVRAALDEAGVAAQHVSVVPLPINLPELYRYYVPLDAVFFLSIYDNWGRRKRQMFEDLGLKTHVLREVSLAEKGLSAGDVRDKMLRGENWSEDVPPAVRKLLEQWEIMQRLRDQAAPAPP
nr:nicotinate-nucleotide adenylyltransferase [Desulfuromonadales bacterium]NIR34221.1 nicotinate-nucleotide adenylyltransferase [Desulfuromonadales bacterium]NIS44172.1 nicotinate-nucleotide adenylyltransferase [Desulfuromonadales bacterium]